MAAVRMKMPRPLAATTLLPTPLPALTLPALTLPALTLLAVTLLAAGCGAGSGGSGNDSGGSVTSTPSSSSSAGSAGTPSPGSSGAASGSSAQGPADLTIVVDDGSGRSTTWHLTCSPAGGDHPTPEKACTVLAEHGRAALPAVDPGRMCTQVYGGPQTARITGTWRGEKVDAMLSRGNGCEISRWSALVGLLPSPDA